MLDNQDVLTLRIVKIICLTITVAIGLIATCNTIRPFQDRAELCDLQRERVRRFLYECKPQGPTEKNLDPSVARTFEERSLP